MRRLAIALVIVMMWRAVAFAFTATFKAQIKGSATSGTVSFPSITPSGGDMLAVLIACATAGTGCVTGVTDPGNSGTFAIAKDCSPSSSMDASIWYLPNDGTNSTAVTIAYSGTQIIDANLIEVSGIKTSSPLDTTAPCNTGASNTQDTGSFTPTSLDFVFGMTGTTGNDTNPSSGPINSYTALTPVLDTSFNVALYDAWLPYSGSSATSTGWTAPNSGTYGAPIVAFFPATPAPGTNLNGTFSVDAGNALGLLSGQPKVWASGLTAVFPATTVGGSTTVNVPSGAGGLTIGNGIMIPGAGPALSTQNTGSLTATHQGSGTGSNTYQWIVVVASVLGGMNAIPIASSTMTGMPAITALGPANYFTFSSTVTSSDLNAVYLLYCSYNSGPYTFVEVDESPNFNGSGDFGQRPSDGLGWPVTLTGGTSFAGQNENFFSYVTAVNSSTQIVVNDTPSTSVSSVNAQPDDSLAIYVTAQRAIAVGGGHITFGPHSYNAWRPMVFNNATQSWQTSIHGSNIAQLYPARVPVSFSNIDIAGASKQSTKIIVRPGLSNFGDLFTFGVEFTPPWNQTYYTMNTVAQGSKSVTLTTASNTSHFTVGGDVWLFTGGFFNSTCPASGGTPGNNCHWSEANTVTGIDSVNGVLYLKYPANKQYYADSAGNPFGIVPVGSNSIHNIGIHDLTVDSYDPLQIAQMMYDESIYNVSMPSGSAGGWDYHSLERNMTVENCNMVLGDDAPYFHAEEEVDEDAGVRYINNVFSANVPPGTLGTYEVFGISLTEGTADFHMLANQVNNLNFASDNGSNNIFVIGNNWSNGVIQPGVNNFTAAPVASFGTPSNWVIANNTVVGAADAGGNTPAVLSTGGTVAYNVSIIGNNVQTLSTDTNGACFALASGTISGNTCLAANASTEGILVVPTVASGVPTPPISVIGNNLTTQSSGYCIQINDPGSSWNGYLLLSSDIESGCGTGDYAPAVLNGHLPNIQVSDEQIAASTQYNPTTLGNQIIPRATYSSGGASISGGGTLTGNSMFGNITGLAATGNVLTPGFTCPIDVICSFQDNTTAGGIKVTARSATSITFSATASDSADYTCGCK
jgi:hypothetical protein